MRGQKKIRGIFRKKTSAKKKTHSSSDKVRVLTAEGLRRKQLKK